MVEPQSCASLVNASPLCSIEQEVKRERANVLAEISAELQRERERNAELLERILILEAQIQERDKKSLLSNGQGSCPNHTERSYKKFRRQKNESSGQNIEHSDIKQPPMELDTQYIQPREAILVNRLVNWMSIDDAQFLHCEKSKDDEFFPDYDDTDDNDDGSSSDDQGEPRYPHGSQELTEDLANDSLAADINPHSNKRESKEVNRKEFGLIGGFQESLHTATSGKKFKGSGSISLQKKPPKVAFCPKEVRRILGLEVLQLKNAESHTIRKIIVFASLGIRHGCEDMYELDFNHFTILLKGEPYISPENPGEHVLYENPGVRRKVFYPNRENLILCPVQVLEEEKAMRPSDASCPSCLFLCIKYGGRTRNIPQNEYVRQHMGRNKLKSFGLIMCQMAMLVHIRSGSFFFKALGITLSFMAGFPDDLVQKETKCRNLDLLQKYFRTDEDAEGEELFLLNPVACATVSLKSQLLPGKTIPAKSKGKKQRNPAVKLNNTQGASSLKSTPPSSATSTKFGLMGYSPIQTHPAAAAAVFQSIASPPPDDSPTFSNFVVSSTDHHHHLSYSNQTLYPLFPPHPANAFLPMMYWRPPNAFPPCPHPSSYYQPFPYSGNFTTSVHPQPYYTLPSCNPSVPGIAEGRVKNDATLGEPDSGSESSSSNTKPSEERSSSKHESG